MSKHTDKTEQQLQRFQREVNNYRKDYNIAFTCSEPKNKDQVIFNNLKFQINNVERYAAKHGYSLECKITANPTVFKKYICSACRKKKSGDYFIFGMQLSYKKASRNPYSWFSPLTKVCSAECKELMTIRLM